MNTDLRERVLLPIGIPLAAIVVTETAVFFFSRVLLTAGKTPAVGIALGAALAILVGAAAVAAAPRMKSGTIAGLLVLALIATVGAGAWAMNRGYAPIEGHEGEGAAAGEAHTALHAVDIAFSMDEIHLPAGEAAEVHFENKEPAGVQHNIAIFSDESQDEVLFRGEIIDGGQNIAYEVGPFEAGEYYFHCDVHPNMKGTVVVK